MTLSITGTYHNNAMHYSGCRLLIFVFFSSYDECRYAECRYAECRYAECRNAECRGAS
jgi:hypothetical protein